MTELLQTVYEALSGLKLTDNIIYEFTNHSPFYDYQIIESTTKEKQTKAAINHIKEAIPLDQEMHVEGTDGSRWILIDLKSIIIHVMHQEDREFYQIEKIFFEREKVQLGEHDGL